MATRQNNTTRKTNIGDQNLRPDGILVVKGTNQRPGLTFGRYN